MGITNHPGFHGMIPPIGILNCWPPWLRNPNQPSSSDPVPAAIHHMETWPESIWVDPKLPQKLPSDNP